jgi:hypothetical protein
MSRLIALALAVGFVSAVSAAVNGGVVHVTGNHSPSCGTVNFGWPTPFGQPSFGPNYGYGAAGFPGGLPNNFGFATGFNSPNFGSNFGTFGFPGGSCNLGCSLPFGRGVCGSNFGVCAFQNGPCNFGCATPFGPGFCGQGVGGFGCHVQSSRVWNAGSLNSHRFSRDNSVFYAPWDLGYSWAGTWGTENYGYGYPALPTPGFLFSAADENGFHVSAPPRPQVINFPTPLENGKAQIKIAPSAVAEVLVNGQPIGTGNSERVFTTPVINGPTNYDVKVRQTLNGKVDEQTFRVTVKPGDRQQVVVLR